MKRFSLIISCLLIGCYCFSQDTTFFDSNWKKVSRVNASYFSILKKQDNKWQKTDYFAKTRQIQMRGTLSAINPEVKDGYFEWFFANGQLKHKGNYINGEETGQHFWYNQNGNIEAIENYVNGKFDGAVKEYYSNGVLKDKGVFSNGLQNGWAEYYREDGSLQSEGNFKNNNRDGIWKYYDEKGKILGADTIQTEYQLTKANLFFQLPNDEWHLAVNEAPNHYIFKRKSVTDSQQREIIPAIMVYVTDAKKYDQNITKFSEDILKRFPDLTIVATTKWGDQGFPLPYNNALFLSCKYSQNDVEHILYMIHIINSDNMGIQMYLDMTKDITEKYENEFWTTIKSIKNTKESH